MVKWDTLMCIGVCGCVCMYVWVSVGYIVMSFSVSSCLLSVGCLNLMCRASRIFKLCCFLAVAMMLNASGLMA